MKGRREVGILTYRHVTSSNLQLKKASFSLGFLNIFATGSSYLLISIKLGNKPNKLFFGV